MREGEHVTRGAGLEPVPCHGWRVGLVCYPSHGGSGVVATELGRALVQRGHCVHIISHQVPFRLGARDLHRNIGFHQVEVPNYPLFLHPPHTLALANKIAEVARFERLDLVHVHYAVPLSVAAALAREVLRPARLPLITTLHGTDVTQTGTDPALRETVTWSLRQSDAVTAVSDSLAASARQAFGLERVDRIYNFIDPAMRRVPNAATRARFAAPDEAVLLHVSNFRAVKNVLDVVRTFALVVRARPAVLLMCGDGPEAGPAQQLVRELGLESRVHFIGVQDDMVDVLSLADLFLLPSAYESFGLGALEAMACEVPVICSRVGGLPEVVREGETGFLRPPGDVDAMAQAALAALEPGLHAQLGQQARRHALANFSARRIIRQYEGLYAEVIGRRAGGAA